MAIIDSQVHVYEANTPKRPWHTVPNWPDHVTGDEMVAAMDRVGVDGAIFISAFSMYRYDASYAVEVQRAHPGRFVRQTNRCWCARCWRMSPCWTTSTPFSRCRASTCTALAQTILPKVSAIPASPTIRKLSRQCRKSQIASDRPGAGCNWT